MVFFAGNVTTDILSSEEGERDDDERDGDDDGSGKMISLLSFHCYSSTIIQKKLRLQKQQRHKENNQISHSDHKFIQQSSLDGLEELVH
ncbi:hypothetical protein Glove_52g150 [Diversispora epigaea]|uniref:Uncharacterized protein n=1 Tax=Diversispora epigaea TaxID=1348612 RepID=A0A397JD67_9GLOM|nr:hypothetical protein Glove_52g150 [Diversispora epigaea]